MIPRAQGRLKQEMNKQNHGHGLEGTGPLGFISGINQPERPLPVTFILQRGSRSFGDKSPRPLTICELDEPTGIHPKNDNNLKIDRCFDSVEPSGFISTVVSKIWSLSQDSSQTRYLIESGTVSLVREHESQSDEDIANSFTSLLGRLANDIGEAINE